MKNTRQAKRTLPPHITGYPMSITGSSHTKMSLHNFNPDNYADREAAWEAFKRLWYADNPPLDNGYYLCGIGGEWVRADETSLDHINGRGGELMFDPNNIQPACGWHNYNKGSKRWQPKVSRETHEFLRFLSDM